MRVMHFVLACGPAQGRSLALALALAHGLRPSATAQHFIVGRGGPRALERAGYSSTLVDPTVDQHVRRVVEEAEREFRPEVIVLVDDLAFGAVTRNELGLDPRFVHNFGVPVVPMEVGLWQGTDGVGAGEDRSRTSGSDGRSPPRLLPVPLARPEADPGAGDHPFPLFPRRSGSEGVDGNHAGARRAARERLGLGPRDRLLVVPAPRLARLLTALPPRTRVAVCRDTWTVAVPGGPARPRAGGVMAGRPVLQAADAVLTTSVRSVILARAVHLGVPGLVVTGDLAAGTAGPGRVEDPYLGAVPRLGPAEAYRPGSPLCDLLVSGPVRDAHLEAVQTYRERVRRLGTTTEVFASAAARAGAGPLDAGRPGAVQEASPRCPRAR